MSNGVQRSPLAVIAGYGVLTGSSLIPGVTPKDVDYFALYDTSKIGELMNLGARYGDGDQSLHSSDWGEQVCLAFWEGEKRVEVFFVQERYFKALCIYTGLLQELCKDEVMRAILSIKAMRVLFAEAVRTVLINIFVEGDI